MTNEGVHGRTRSDLICFIAYRHVLVEKSRMESTILYATSLSSPPCIQGMIEVYIIGILFVKVAFFWL